MFYRGGCLCSSICVDRINDVFSKRIKLKSPTTNASARIFSIYCRTFILFLFLFEIYHNITFWGKRLFCVVFQVLCTSLFVEVISLAVNDDYKRHVFHIKLADSFCSKIIIRNHFRFFDTF